LYLLGRLLLADAFCVRAQPKKTQEIPRNPKKSLLACLFACLFACLLAGLLACLLYYYHFNF